MISKKLLFVFTSLRFKIKKFFLLIALLIVNIFFIGWGTNSTSDTITTYYYYKNQPYNLSLRTDKIFIKTKQILSQSEFRAALSQYFQITSTGKFDLNEKRQFVQLAMPYDASTIIVLINTLNQNPSFEYSSPVYSPEDNNKVLQGVEDEILVQFKKGVNQNQISNYLQSKDLTIVQSLNLTGGLSYVLKVPRSLGMYAMDVANMVYNSGLVNWSEPNFYYSGLLSYIPNDQFFPMQWSIKNTGSNIPGGISGTAGCDMRVDSAWNLTLGTAQCKVGMVDTGIDTLHEDLMANLVPGSGYDFINNHAGCMDDHNHGTCTAGIVAAVGNDSIGISGIAPNCKLIGVKIFNASGSTNSSAITNGLLYSWQQGEWVSSNSWGGGSPISAADQAILDGTTLGRSGKGTVFCFASGNGNGPLSWPSTNPNVISIGGNSPCNQRKSPSSCDLESFWGANYGTGLNVVAPCVKVYATDRMGAVGYDPTNYFSTFNGTSSATPNAAGVCALLLSLDSTLRWDSVRVKLCRTADKVGSYSYTSTGPIASLGNTWNNEMGYGKINAYRLLTGNIQPPPSAQHDISVGPFLSLPSSFLVGNAYPIKTRVQNLGTSNETGIPIKFYINGTLTNTTNINLVSNQVDSVTNTWTPAVAGLYTLKYIASLSSDTNHLNDTVQTTITVNASIPALCEGFSGSTFPPTDWTINYTGTNYWSRATVSGYCVGTGSALISFYDFVSGSQQLNTKSFSPTGTNDSLVFQDAYATYQSENDQLQIQTSTDAGTTWTALVTLNGGVSGELVTAPPTTSPFVPTCTQWKYQRFLLPPQTNMIQFNAISAFGNNLYIDSICLHLGVGIKPISTEKPMIYSLSQNYPNPFNPATKIQFALPKAGIVKLIVYDVLGRQVAILVNEFKLSGYYNITFNGSNLASGVYFYRIESGDFKEVKKMLLVK